MGVFYAGVDLGGTKTRVGLVEAQSPDRVTCSVTVPTNREDPAEGLRKIADLVRELAVRRGGGEGSATGVLAAGIGAPGPLNVSEGRLLDLPNLPKWREVPVARFLEQELGVPVVLENDANAAAVGEMAFGAGRRLKDFVYVTLGTGIGGALVLGGELYRGHWGGAGEVGHIQVDPLGPRCGCGRRGCVEALAAGPAIERSAGRPAPEVFELAAAGDAQARDVLQAAGRALGKGLASVLTVLDVEAVVFGGGMAQGNADAVRIYLDACKEEIEGLAFLPGTSRVSLLLGTLGDDAALLGAAWLARRKFEDREEPGEALPVTVEKPWGKEVWWARTPAYAGKTIYVAAGHRLSLQYHRKKRETMFFVSGEGTLYLDGKDIPVRPGLSVEIKPGMVHRVTAVTDVVFHEASTGELDDVVRLQDEYGRSS